MKNIVILTAALLAFSLGRARGEVTIDDFSTTQILVSASGYVSGPGILGTERDTQAFAPTADIGFTTPGRFHAFNPDPVNWGTIFLTYDGVDQNLNSSFLNGLGSVDLTQGGVNDRFRIPVLAASHDGGTLTLTARNIGLVGSSITVPLPTSPGILELAFADFQLADFAVNQPVNFASVGFLELTLGLFPGESYTFESIYTTTPEPGSSALISVAGVATTWLRRRGIAHRG